MRAIIVAALAWVLSIQGAIAGMPLLQRLQDPVRPACVSSPFGPRVLPGKPQAGTYHYGIDLPAPVGAPVQAVASGTVIAVIDRGPGGLQMIVQHPGFVGIYSHFGSIASQFLEGQRLVRAGEQLGEIGLTGVTYGAHLYFAMMVRNQPIDPMPYLAVALCKPEYHNGQSVTLSADGKVLPSRHYRGLYRTLLATR
ncbi:MAG: M23 family metallopeptidase [Acetobacteraceae bacterium]|nr:M23 family metallopeptidase [Acetobacteraceae bacterium]